MDILQESPSQVLRRVHAYDEVELPSLPNITSSGVDFDAEETDDYYGGGSGGGGDSQQPEDEDDLSTPHVARYRSPPRTGSTIVPRQRTPIEEPTPLAHRDSRDLSTGGFTSTPYTEQLRLSSSRRSLSNSTDSKQSRQPATYSDHYDSDASSQRLPVPDLSDLPDPSLPTAESFDGSVMDTPMPRAFAAKKISPAVVPRALAVAPPDSRIPSLSRSEVSGTSHEATTPDQPPRFLEQLEEPTHDYPTHEYNTSIASVPPPSESEHPSPLKSEATPSAVRYMDMPTTATRAAATPFNAQMAALRDVTPAYRNRETTPSPGNTPASEYATPRANDSDRAERRKSHVLTVLQSSKLPSRFKVRGTPHPVRRISLAPDASAIHEEGNSTLASTNADQSFLSIASSQDLTMDRRGSRYHQRANTSVPNIVLGTGTAASPGGPENRAEFVKIGKHTNMMNNALHEENAKLAQELQDWQNEYAWLTDTLKASGVEVTDDGEVILPASARLNESTSSTASQRKARFDDLEGQIRQKDEQLAALEKKLEAGRQEVAALKSERDEAVAAVREESQAEFVQKIEAQMAQVAEITAECEREIADLKAQRDAALNDAQRLEVKAAGLEADVKRLQSETATSDEIEALKDKISQLETELDHAREDADAADAEADKARDQLTELEHERDDLHEQLQTARDQADRLRDELNDLQRDEDDQVAALKARVTEAEEDKEDALAALDALKGRVTELNQLLSDKEEEMRAQHDTIIELEKDIAHRADVEAALRHDIADLEADLKIARSTLADQEAEIASLQTALEVAEMVGNKTLDHPDATAIQTLKERLDDAHRENERLKKELGDAPERQWAIESRDARIKALEAEKEALLERVRTKNFASPMRSMVTSTPIVNRVLANLRTPKTPGPMKELSWLQTTIGDSNESILRAQLEHLQQELEAANSQLDKNFNRIEAAGLDSVSLAEKLVRAQDRIAELEEQLRQMARDNKQSLASLNLGQSKNERLENALDAVHEQMGRLKADTEAEKERLKDESRRLRTALRDLQSQAEQQIEDLGAQIVEIRRDADDKIAEVEEQVQSLRAEKETLNTNLKAARVTIGRLEGDIRELQQAKTEAQRENRELQQAKTDAQRENRRLQDAAMSLEQNQDQLRSLQDMLREAQADADKLRDTLRERNRSLETAEAHIETLKAERERITRELLSFGDDLSTQRRECVKFGTELEALRQTSTHKAAQAKAQITQLESDLRWTRERFETATRQAKAAEREYTEVEARALEAERKARDLERHARELEQRSHDLEHDLEQQAVELQCRDANAAADAAANAVAETRAKYKAQARRLAAQIEYLKVLYARENTFRNALALQKKFLLVLVGGMSLNEQATLRAIASMGFPVPPPPRPKRTLKAVAIAVVATIRARRMADEWQQKKESRHALTRR